MHPAIYTHKEKDPEENYELTHRPWHRRDKETEKAYQAFEVFAELGYTRNLERTALKIYGEEHWETNFRFIEKWHREHSWEMRAVEFDRFMQKNLPDFEEEKERQSRYKIAKAMPDITETAIDGALGRKKVDRTQGALIMNLLDRGGPAKKQNQKGDTNINLQIEAPKLPAEVTNQFEEVPEAEDAHESLAKEADALKPKHFD